MLKSKQENPCIYLHKNIDMTELSNFRKPYCKQAGLRVTTNDFFLCAMARAAAAYPLFAGKQDPEGDYIQISHTVGIGFAVAAPQGLVVPVIKNITQLTLAEIAKNSNQLLKKARSNKLLPSDFDGANIVLTGLGMYGMDLFYAIAPPGTSSILSIGKINDTFISVNGSMYPRRTMAVGLAVNRKIIHEMYAAEFLNCIAEQIENPRSMTE